MPTTTIEYINFRFEDGIWTPALDFGWVILTTATDDDGNKYITVDGASDTFKAYGGDGNDTIYGVVNYGEGGDDVLSTWSRYGSSYGGDGNDWIDGSGYGGAGNDVLTATSDTWDQSGGDGNDVIYASGNKYGASGGAGDDQIYAGADSIGIGGGEGDDILYGSSASLHGGAGADILAGGDGYDEARYYDATSGVTIDLTLGEAQDTGGAGVDTLDQIEGLFGSRYDDVLIGTGVGSTLYGYLGDDVLSGAEFTDGAEGNDLILDGRFVTTGSGYDGVQMGAQTVIDFSAASDVILIDFDFAVTTAFHRRKGEVLLTSGPAGTVTISADKNGDGVADLVTTLTVTAGAAFTKNNLIRSFSGSATGEMFTGTAKAEAFIAGAGNDVIVAGAGNDHVWGGVGDDLVDGGLGNDFLWGGYGNDILDGGAGNDLLSGGEGSDTVSYMSATAGVSLNLYFLTAQSTGGSGKDTVVSVENVIGSEFNDTLQGTVDANVLVGGLGIDTVSYSSAAAGVNVSLSINVDQDTAGAGVDTLSGFENLTGGAFADVLEGTGGDNILSGGAGLDTASYAHASSAVQVSLLITIAQNTGGAGTDTLLLFENLKGSVFGDILTGNTKANILWGEDGDDVIAGGGGADVLYGGAGFDRFVFAQLTDSLVKATGQDRVLDFSSAQGDQIDLSAIDARTGTIEDDSFVLASKFTKSAGQLVVSTSGSGWLVQGDVNGDGKADFGLFVQASQALGASDFIL